MAGFEVRSYKKRQVNFLLRKKSLIPKHGFLTSS